MSSISVLILPLTIWSKVSLKNISITKPNFISLMGIWVGILNAGLKSDLIALEHTMLCFWEICSSDLQKKKLIGTSPARSIFICSMEDNWMFHKEFLALLTTWSLRFTLPNKKLQFLEPNLQDKWKKLFLSWPISSYHVKVALLLELQPLPQKAIIHACWLGCQVQERVLWEFMLKKKT